MEIQLQTTKTFMDIADGSRIVLLQGGTRSGKSYASIQFLIVKALEEPNQTISIVRKSFPSLRISALRDFKQIMRDLDIWDEDNWRASENAYTFHNGSMIEFLSTQDSERRKGTKRDWLFIDEVTELDYSDYFQLTIRTTKKVILAFNPNISANHWLFEQVQTHPECETYVSTYLDNPWLESELVKEIELLRETSPSYWRIYGLGEIGIVDGLIFDNINVISEIPEEAELLGYGMDFGFTQDPSTLIALFKVDGGILYDEIFYLKGLLTNEIGALIKEAYGIHGKAQVIADSAEPRIIEEIFRMGINIKPCVKGPDSIMQGIDVMKQHKLFVTKKSANMINEFYGYTWAKDKEEKLTNKPDPRSDDHCIDAARYVSSWMLSSKKRNHGKYTIKIM
jgi:phage terminase large subunit